MGRVKLIETPEKLWGLFTEYKNEVKSNPRVKHVFVGKDGSSEYERLERPLTMEGFECFCYDKGVTVSNYFEDKHNAYADYYAICSRVKREIRHDQIEGGMVGQYNTSITQRLNGLTDKQEIKTIQEQPLFPE
jgi:hypothetical protein